MPKTIRTPAQDDVFFDALAAGETVGHAATQAGYRRNSADVWRASDPLFAALWQQALDLRMARRRARADANARRAHTLMRMSRLTEMVLDPPRDDEAKFLAVLFAGPGVIAPPEDAHDKATQELIIGAMRLLLAYCGLRIAFTDAEPVYDKENKTLDRAIRAGGMLMAAGVRFELQDFGGMYLADHPAEEVPDEEAAAPPPPIAVAETTTAQT